MTSRPEPLYDHDGDRVAAPLNISRTAIAAAVAIAGLGTVRTVLLRSRSDAPDPVRGSFRARTLRQASALTVRRLAERTPVSSNTLPLARVVIDRAMRSLAPVLRDTTVEPIVDGAVRGEWVRGPKASRTDAVILYVHGCGFIAGSAHSYRGVTSRLSTATRLPVFAVDYRLAPEHPFPAAPHDVARAYRWLLARYPAHRIVVAGDSAGGFLAADLAITNAHNRTPAPAALLLFSPMTDLGLEIAAGSAAAEQDGIISVPIAAAAIAHFTTDRLELLPRPGMSFPPTLIHASDSELFTADAIALSERLRAAGAVCELAVWPDQMHVFHAMPALVPEARTAYRAAARFVTDILDATTRTERTS